jgi:hypothetical protein
MDRKESSKKPLSLDLQFSVIRFAIFGDSLYRHFSQTPEKKFALDRNWDIIRLALISMDC